MIPISSKFSQRLVAYVVGVLIALPVVNASTIPLDDVPAFLLSGAASNLIITLGDSRSMNAAYLPDSAGITDVGDRILQRYTKRAKSACFNHAYYDPNVPYLPADKANGATFGDAPFSGAPVDPFASGCPPTSPGQFPEGCPTVSLSTGYRAEWLFGAQYAPDPLDLVDASGDTRDLTQAHTAEAGPAYYYEYNSNGTGCTCAAPAEGEACPDKGCLDEACYQRVDVTTESADEKQNFANWYSYYRTRLLATKTAVSLVAHELPADVRIAYQGLNEKSLFGSLGRRLPFGEKSDPAASTPPVTAFDSATRVQFYSWLYSVVGDKTNTPLVESTLLASEAFRDLDVYREDPGDSTSPVYPCRRNLHIAFTDGAWSGQFYSGVGISALYPSSAIEAFSANWDKVGIAPFPTSDLPADIAPGLDLYPAVHPFKDENAGTLADIAFYYWATDLCADASDDCGALANNVPLLISDTSSDVDDDGDVDDFDRFWNPKNDPASWQHVASYFIGLGVNGFRSFPEDLPLLFDQGVNGGFPGTNDLVNFPRTALTMDVRYKSDDIWHAAINGRGSYVSANNVHDLVVAFRDILDSVAAAVGSSSVSAATFNSGLLTTGSKIYQVMLEPVDWSGDVRAYNISLGENNDESACEKPRGELCESSEHPAWAAAEQLDELSSLDGRKIVTLDLDPGGTSFGIPFLWDSLHSSQKQAILGGIPVADATAAELAEAEARLDYVRGERTNEQNDPANPGTYSFRDRSTVLGDIIRSGALYVGPPNRFYTDNAYSSGDNNFKSRHEDRKGVVYVGANDGMLHAFDGDSGVELFSYVPNLVFEQLADLSGLDYQHQSYVDGPSNAGDVHYDGAWHTVLVASTGLGAQGLFALDVTNPIPAVNPTESDYTSAVRWELSDGDDPDVGYVFGKPAIVRIGTADDFKWVAIFGNGYNSMAAMGEDVEVCEEDDGHCTISESGNAVLFIVDIENGDIIGKMDTDWGQAEDPTGAARGNGLAEVTVVDGNSDGYADFAYAGDLFGNLWKFDLTDLTDLSAGPVGGGPLFQSTDSAGTAQPITTPVAVTGHPIGLGAIVLFGTGKFFAQDDVDDTSTQSFYGVWDGPDEGCVSEAQAPMGRDDLLEQEFIVTDVEHQSGETLVRVASDNSINWNSPTCDRGWFIDLSTAGERVHVAPQVRLDRVVFTSVIPVADRCTAGAQSWVTALDARDGSRLSISPFDFNLDGQFDGSQGAQTTDLIRVMESGTEQFYVGSSIRIANAENSGGVYSAPATMVVDSTTSIGYVATSEGDLINLRESSALGWRVWQQAH